MAYSPEQVQFLVPKLSGGISPFSSSLLREQSALASVHTGDRDPYDPFAPIIEQSGQFAPADAQPDIAPTDFSAALPDSPSGLSDASSAGSVGGDDNIPAANANLNDEDAVPAGDTSSIVPGRLTPDPEDVVSPALDTSGDGGAGTFSPASGVASSGSAADTTPVVGAPTLEVTPATGLEDGTFPLEISAGPTTTGSTVTITLDNLPDGTVLSAGQVNPDGSVTLTEDELDGLTITPPADYEGEFDITVTATATDGQTSATTTSTLPVTVQNTADAPDLDVTAASGLEDTAISLDIDAAITGTGEILTVTIDDIPAGATLSAGTVNADGSVTLTADQIDDLTITPPLHFDGNFDLSISATASDGTNEETSTATLSVAVEGVADTPALATPPASGNEDTPIALDISSALIDSDETLSITISDIPAGASLSAGTVNPDGSVTLTPAELSGLQITPPADFSGDFDLTVIAISTDGTDTAQISDTLNVDVIPVADTPTLAVTPASGDEDSPIALDIASNLTDSDEVLSITISDIPAGATLSAGTVNPDGSVTLTPAELTGLTITPPADFSGDFDLTVTATSTDGTDTASTSQNLNVDVTPVADTPTLAVTPAAGNEDTPIALDIASNLSDSDEVLSVTISDIPAGATLSAGTVNPDGTVTLTPAELTGLTITPPTDFSGDFDLTVTATSTDGTDTAQISDTLNIDVIPVADTPTLAVTPASGDEDSPIALDIASNLTDSDEVLSVTISDIPAGATLSAGTVNPDGTVTLTPAELTGLTITPPADFSGDLDLTVTATSTDGADTASTSQNLNVDVAPVADTPTLAVTPAAGNEDSPIALDIASNLTDSDEVLSVTISDIPAGATLSAGTVNPDGTVTLTPAELTGLTITPPADFSGDFDLTVTATSTDGTDTASTSQNLNVDVTPVADTPTLAVTPASGNEDTAIDLDINSALTDSGEVLSITISDIPAGATLSAGTVNPDGSVTLTAAELTGLTITPPADYNGDFDLSVTATSTDGTDTASLSDTLNVNVIPVADTPTLAVTPASGNEDTAIDLDISSALTVPTEVLSVTISDIPTGATLSAGTVNPDGTVTLTPAELSGLQITPPADFSGDFDLTVTATSTDGTDTASTTLNLNVDVAPIADTPTLAVTPVSGNEDTPIALNIGAGLSDADETLTAVISDIPTGATLSAGTVNPNGSVSLTGAELTGLTITPPSNFNGSFDLSVEVTATDGTDTASLSETLNVNVNPVADAPTLSVTPGSGNEDTAIDLDISSALTVSSEVLLLTISDIPAGATLSAGTVNPDGTVSLDPADVAGLQITPPSDYSGTFDLTVTATSTDGTDTASVSEALSVNVVPVADTPTLGVTPASGNEDTAISLDIAAGLTDLDETLQVTISDIPAGSVLSAGTVNPDGSVTLSAADLSGLTITPPEHFSGTFDLDVVATAIDGTDTSSLSTTLSVDVVPVADAPTLVANDVTGDEDTTVTLDLSSALVDSSESQEIVISGVPAGFSLSAGTVNPDGSITLTAGELSGLSIDAPTHYNGSFDLTVTATSTDGTDTASSVETFTVTFDAVADAPTLSATPASGIEDTPVALDIASALTAPNEVLSITLSDVPAGTTFSAGTVNPDGTVTLTPAELSGLVMTPPEHVSGTINLTVTATSVDGSDSASTTTNLPIDLTAVADTPTLSVNDVTGNEDTPIALDVASALVDPSETLSVTISDIPAGAVLSAGTVNPDGSVTLTAAELQNLTIQAPNNFSGSFDLSINATSTDGADVASIADNFTVNVLPVADAPDLTVTPATGIEDTLVDLDITTALTDISETLSVTISDIPAGATLSAGTLNPDGTVTLSPAELSGLQLDPPANFSGQISLTVTSTSADGPDTASTVKTLDVDIAPVADTPTLAVNDITGNEDTAIALDIASGLTDPSEVLSITVSDIPDGATLSKGTVNADGSVTLTPAQLSGLTITPPEHFSGDFDLSVVATSVDGPESASISDTFNVNVNPVADTPTINAQNVTGDEDTPITLDISSSLVDPDETLSITFSDIPTGSTLSAGTVNPDGTVTLTPAELSGLTITPPEHFSGQITLTATATSVDGADSASNSDQFDIVVNQVADAPNLLVNPATGPEDTVIALDIEASLTDPSEILNVVIDNIPEGASFSAGSLNANGTLTLTPDELPGLTFTPPTHYSGPIDLDITAISLDGRDSATTNDTLSINVTPVADTPVLTAIRATGNEDSDIALDIRALLTDTSEVLNVVISDIPAGATLSAGTVNPDGTVTIAAADLAGLTIRPPQDFNGNMNLTVTATSTDGSDVAQTSESLTVRVVPVADAPTLTVVDPTVLEDNVVSLDISAALTVPTETLSVTISDIPDGVTINGGTYTPNGNVTFTPDQLAGATMTTPSHFSGTLDLTVTATSADGPDTASVTETLSVTVDAVADGPNLKTPTASGAEDNDIALNISAPFVDGSETLGAITISGIPDGVTLSAGTVNPDGSVTLTPAELTGLTLTPVHDYSGSFNLTVTASTTDGTDIAVQTKTMAVSISPVADTPELIVNTSTGFVGNEIPLDFSAAVTDPSETLYLSISGIPDGAELSAGAVNANGSVTLTEAELANLTITPPSGYTGTFDLEITATSEDGSDKALNTETMTIIVAPNPGGGGGSGGGGGGLGNYAVSGDEDTAIGIDIQTVLGGAGATSYTISDIPAGATLSAGTVNPDGTVTLTPVELLGLTVTPPENFSGQFNLTVDGNPSVTGPEQIAVNVYPVADAPNLVVNDIAANEDDTVFLDISASLTDPDENLAITISDIPEGVSLSAGIENPDGSITLTPDELSGLTLTPPKNFSGSLDLTISATSAESGDRAVTSDTLTVTLAPVADAPALSAPNVSGDEDTTIALNASVSVTDTDETISSVVISDIPAGVTLNGGTLNPDGTVSVTPAELADMTITPPANFSGSLNLTITATSTEAGDTAVSTKTVTVNVDPVADTPMVVANDVVGNEDGVIALDLSAISIDPSENLTVFISDIPEGVVLSDGTLTADGSVILTPDQLSNLTVTPPTDYNGTFDMTINVVAADGSDRTTYSDTFSVTVDPIADTPTLTTVPARGDEDSAIDLDITSSLIVDSEVLDIVISGIPTGATLSAGTVNPDGTVTVTAAELSGLTITPPSDFSGSFNLTVSATSTDGTSTDTVSKLLAVTVDPVADAPIFTPAPAIGDEDTSIALDLGVAVTDSSEVLSVNISNIPSDAVLSAGTLNPDGSYTLTPAQLTGLNISMPENYNGTFDLDVSVTVVDGNDTTSVSQVIPVTFTPVADPLTVSVSDASGLEDTALVLDISATLSNPDEILSVDVSDIPAGSVLSAGTVNPDGTVTLTPAELSGLTITPPNNFSGSFDLTVTANSIDGSSVASVSDVISVSVAPQADTPTLSAQNATGAEDTAIALTIDAALSDQSEILTITIADVPVGSTLSAGTDNGNGTWSLAPGDLDGLTITPPSDFYGSFDLAITATSTDGSETASIQTVLPVDVTSVADSPMLSLELPGTVLEDTATPLTVNVGALEPGELLEVTIEGLTSDQTLSAGTLNPDGSWTLTQEELVGLNVTALDPGSNLLTVTATANDPASGTSANTVATINLEVLNVAEAPSLNLALPGIVLEDTETPLTIDVGVLAPGELLDVKVEGLTSDQTLSAGVKNPDGSWSLTQEELVGLNVTALDPGSNLLTVTATVTDPISGTSDSTIADINLEVLNIAEGPALTLGLPGIVLEDTETPLTIDVGALAPGELLDVKVDGLTSDQTLSAGVKNPDGSWSLTQEELVGLNVTALDPGSNLLTVTATVTDPI
ncbi:beta strand repeat-containing protein, partial [Thalassospira sp.]|uniref:beta strand repeat-containing protein n=1 Tax=Thalassospira sp. TaxID=1912094 RepID=UPI003AA8148F